MHSLSRTRSFALFCLPLVLACHPAAAQKSYIAVGDSLAYGYKSSNAASANYTPTGGAGSPGYTASYANFLSSQSGQTYTVVNLGIVGETAASLASTTTDSGVPNSLLNSNYGVTDAQRALLGQKIVTAGSSLGVITIQIGANDILEAVSSPGFQTDPSGTSTAALLAVSQNYTALLTQVKASEGSAFLSNVALLGYYDPYAALPSIAPYSDLKAASAKLVPQLNSVIAQEAAAFGARYVDLYTPFSQHYSEYDKYTLANSIPDQLPPTLGFPYPVPNDHPTDLGYALIAQQLSAAPEPSSIFVWGLGVLGLGLVALRARRRQSL